MRRWETRNRKDDWRSAAGARQAWSCTRYGAPDAFDFQHGFREVRPARQVPLVPLLQKRGVQLMEKDAGNFELPAFPGLIVKESYWRWPQRNLAGNTIDFFVQVLGMNFHNAMRQITGS